MRMRLCALLVILSLLLGSAALCEGYKIDAGNGSNFGRLLIDLLHAYERPSPTDSQEIGAALDAIRAVRLSDYEVAQSISSHWGKVYLNTDGEYTLCLHDGGERATALEQTGLQDSATHAFVVLGFELKNGKMTQELKGRCDAAAAAARSFPSAILVCSGGATGKNNPDRHTEAGLMRDYLTQVCGIDANRIYIDEKALNTAQNAINTFEIMRSHGIQTFTLVTSSYHQRWGQVIYNATAALCRQTYGSAPQLLENYNYEIEAYGNYKRDDIFAVKQLCTVLGLSDRVIQEMKKAYKK